MPLVVFVVVFYISYASSTYYKCMYVCIYVCMHVHTVYSTVQVQYKYSTPSLLIGYDSSHLRNPVGTYFINT